MAQTWLGVLVPVLLVGASGASVSGCTLAPAQQSPQIERPSTPPEGFWDHWGDGQAELDAYDLTIPRYGELREGIAVQIHVTEPFTRAQRVKSDGGRDDEYQVLKLNDVRDFQTGVYDYNAMTSAFVPLDGSLSRGQPTKVSLGVQEWCGHVYDQLIVDPGRYDRVRHSYFDGEADRRWEGVEVPEGAVFGDTLPIVVRGLAGPLVQPGEERSVPYLPTLLDTRLAHTDLAWGEATIARAADASTVEVPAGSFEVHRWTVEVDDGPTTTFDVEAAPPHRVVGWSRSTGEEAVLRRSVRTPYWKHNHPEGRRLLAELGLKPVVARQSGDQPPTGAGQRTE